MDKEEVYMNKVSYALMVGFLVYEMVGTRSGIA